jgi:hypothetical protein
VGRRSPVVRSPTQAPSVTLWFFPLVCCFFLWPTADRARHAKPRSCSLRPQDLKLFSGNANVELAQQIAEHLGKKLGNITVSRFADGTVLAGMAGSSALLSPCVPSPFRVTVTVAVPCCPIYR